MKKITLTINNIPIHSTKEKPQYSDVILTVYTFGTPKNLNDLKLLLIDFTERVLGYDLADFDGWFDATVNVAEQTALKGEAVGLGYYKAQLSYENPDGRIVCTEKYDVRNKTFGNEI